MTEPPREAQAGLPGEPGRAAVGGAGGEGGMGGAGGRGEDPGGIGGGGGHGGSPGRLRGGRALEVLFPLLILLAFIFSGVAAVEVAEHASQIHQDTARLLQLHHDLILKDRESISHLQSRVNFLDKALDQVCKAAALPCPPPFPDVKPIPKPTGGQSAAG